ncbi:hypothetical protein M8J77_016418 [Diaphorina citri]|nr:hypothetical protein M8J77_016418 [Diaphorina citri]
MLCKHVQTSATHIKDIRQKTANLSDTHKRLLQCSKNFAATFSNTSKLTNFIALHKSGTTIRKANISSLDGEEFIFIGSVVPKAPTSKE